MISPNKQVKLVRDTSNANGIFGTLVVPGADVYQTLEHAYKDSILCVYRPKLPTGSYICKLGIHQLSHGAPFMTYEVSEVPGHTGILIHPGNVNDDSEGCILIGRARSGVSITQSRDAFKDFMTHMTCVDEFTLEVS